jgi:tetratricopeptide (TPR) repeat protein
MGLPEQIKQIFKEIEVYSSHSLYGLAKKKCIELADLIKCSDQFKDKNILLKAISRKIGSIEDDARTFEGIHKTARISSKELNVVRQLVLVSDNPDIDGVAWEVAKACLILGQFEKALNEFNRLIVKNYKVVAAAKNALRCYIGMSALNDAIAKYQEWDASGIFSPEQLEKIRAFLQTFLNKKGVDTSLAKPAAGNTEPPPFTTDADFFDIVSVKLSIADGSGEKSKSLLDVIHQKGAMFDVIVSKDNKALLDILKIGKEIQEVEIHTSAIIFDDRCIVLEAVEIESGPNQGDFCVRMTIVEPDVYVSDVEMTR